MWKENDGTWIPTDPTTQQRHSCPPIKNHISPSLRSPNRTPEEKLYRGQIYLKNEDQIKRIVQSDIQAFY